MNTQTKQTLGILGGLGPMASAYFLELITAMTQAETDQQHLDVILFSAPSIPDRTAYLLDNTNPSPLPAMTTIGKKLVCQGAEVIAIPCVTAHALLPRLQPVISVPIVDIVSETAQYLKHCGISRAGILATNGTVATKLLQNAFSSQGITPVLPGKEGQARVTDLIYRDMKAGNPPDMEAFSALRRELTGLGAEVIVLGCTELSLIKRGYPVGAGVLDMLEVLAKQSVLRCGGCVKDKYRCLITK